MTETRGFMDYGRKKSDGCIFLNIYYKDSMQLQKITTNIGDLKLNPVLGKIDIKGAKVACPAGYGRGIEEWLLGADHQKQQAWNHRKIELKKVSLFPRGSRIWSSSFYQ